MKKTQIAAFSYDGTEVSFEITDISEARKAVSANTEEERGCETIVHEDIEMSLISYGIAVVMTRIITKYGCDITKIKKHVFGSVLKTVAEMLESSGAPDEDLSEIEDLVDQEIEDIICLYGDVDDINIAANIEKLIGLPETDSSDRSVEVAMTRAAVKALANAIAVITQRELIMGLPETETLTETIMSVPEALNRKMDGVEIGTFFGKNEKELYDRVLDDEGKNGFVS